MEEKVEILYNAQHEDIFFNVGKSLRKEFTREFGLEDGFFALTDALRTHPNLIGAPSDPLYKYHSMFKGHKTCKVPKEYVDAGCIIVVVYDERERILLDEVKYKLYCVLKSINRLEEYQPYHHFRHYGE